MSELDAPPQLPVEIELDRVTVRVRGDGQAAWRRIAAEVWAARETLAAVSVVLMFVARMTDSLLLSAVLVVGFAGVGLAGLVGRSETSTTVVRWDARALDVSQDDGAPTRIPLAEIGKVTVIGGTRPTLRVRRVGTDPLLIPMDNEPAEHAVWLSDALEAAARAARARAGIPGKVPAALEAMRRGP